MKMVFLAHMVGVLLNFMFDPVDGLSLVGESPVPSRASQQYDKDFLGNKRVEVCGMLLAQQVRNALYRMQAGPTLCATLGALGFVASSNATWPRP